MSIEIPSNPFDISFEQNKEEIEKANDLMRYGNNFEEAWKIYNRLAEKASDEKVQTIYANKADGILTQMKEETERRKRKDKKPTANIFEKNNGLHGEQCLSTDHPCGKTRMDGACNACCQHKIKNTIDIKSEGS